MTKDALPAPQMKEIGSHGVAIRVIKSVIYFKFYLLRNLFFMIYYYFIKFIILKNMLQIYKMITDYFC